VIDSETLAAHVGFVRGLARALVDDIHLAEDVAQSTLTEALRRPPPDLSGLRSWLATVLRNLVRKEARSRRRRMVREQRTARPISVPSIVDTQAKETLIRNVVDSVFSLREPYRSAVVMRFYDDLPPREIARMTGVPVETVRTRIKRALSMLRADLEAKHREAPGGLRTALLVLLDPRAAAEGAAASGAGAGGAAAAGSSATGAGRGWIASLAPSPTLLWTTVVTVALGAAIVLFVVLGSSRRTEERIASRDSPALEREPPAVATLPPRTPEDTPPPLASDEGAAHPATGEARIRLRFPEGDPAAGVRGRVVADAELRDGTYAPAGQRMALVADDEGVILPGDLEPGSYVLFLDRMRGAIPFEIVAGETTDVAHDLPPGVDCHGVVVDEEGAAVAGAEIYLATDRPWTDSGVVVARAEADGTFRIRALSKSRFVGARKSGRAPSDAVYVAGLDNTQRIDVRLEMPGPGGEIQGRVLLPDGRAAIGAHVIVERTAERQAVRRAGDGNLRMDAPPGRATSDESGTFLVVGLRPDRYRIVVLPEVGGAARIDEVRVHTGTVPLEIRLQEAASLRGTVVDGSGAPAKGARVRVRDSATCEFRPELQAATDASGRYAVAGIAPGRLHVEATGPGARGVAREDLDADPGQAIEWNATLGGGAPLVGRVIGGAGEPLAGWRVVAYGPYAVTSDRVREQIEALRTRPGMVQSRFDRLSFEMEMTAATTDAEGRFEMAHLLDVPHTIWIFEPGTWEGVPCHCVEGILPSPAEQVFAVPDATRATAFVEGRIRDDSRRRHSTVSVGVQHENPVHTPANVEIEPGNTFRVGPLPAGEYRLRIDFPRDPSGDPGERSMTSERFDLAPGSTLDLGEIVIEPFGEFVATVKGSSDLLEAPPSFELVDPSGRVRIPCGFDGSEARATDVPPGEYRFSILGLGSSPVASRAAPAQIHAGETTKVEVTVGEGRACRFRFVEGGPQHTASFAVYLEIDDADGRFVASFLDRSRMNLGISLGSGRYEAVLVMSSGRGVRQAFEVPPGEGPVEPIAIRYR